MARKIRHQDTMAVEASDCTAAGMRDAAERHSSRFGAGEAAVVGRCLVAAAAFQ